MMDRADLHTHSTFSDGVDTPTRIVSIAEGFGLGGIALTDHDTLDGLEEFMSAPTTKGITRIPGVEISTEYDDWSVHLLGFHIPKASQSLESELHWLRDKREERFMKILSRVEEMGVHPSEEYMSELMEDVDSLGRPHIGKLLVDHDVVEGMDEAFDKYLHRGGPLYIKKERLLLEKGINLLLDCGAVPVIAHPLDMKGESIEDYIREYKKLGVLGVEVEYDYSKLSIREDPAVVRALVEELDLIGTGGTDYHGGNWRSPIGTVSVPIQVLGQLEAAAKELGNDLNSWDA